jgi:hypothetical protein
MKTVEIFRAQDDDAPEVQISIRHPTPHPDASPAFYASEGAALAVALCASCPNGTINALVGALLAKRAEKDRT